MMATKRKRKLAQAAEYLTPEAQKALADRWRARKDISAASGRW